MTREELIAALERAEGPSWELDVEIMCLVYADLKPTLHLEGWYSAFGDRLHVENYTSSIDAAITLVPLGWDWCVACISGKWDAQVGEANTFMSEGAVSSRSAAIALCTAALRALAA